MNVTRKDIEFEHMQEDINRVRYDERVRLQQQEAVEQAPPDDQVQSQIPQDGARRVKITFDEFEKMTYRIVAIMKEFEY